MTVVMVEGFDHLSSRINFGTKGWQFIDSGTFVFNDARVTTGRLSGQAYYVATKSDAGEAGHLFPTRFEMIRTLPTTYTEIVLGFAALRYDTTEVGQDSVCIQTAGGASLVTFGWDSGNHPFFGSIGSSFVAVPNVWNYYELRVKVNGSSGQYEMRINGATVAEGSGVVVADLGTTPIGRIRLHSYHDQRSNVSHGFSVDDMYVVDTSGPAPRNTFLGDCRVETIMPTAEGSSSDFTPSTGTNNAALVDEIPPNDDTDYVSAAATGAKDLNVHSDITSPVATVHAVQTNIYVRKESAGASQVSPVTRQGGVDYPSAKVHTLSTSYACYSDLQNQDPTGANWTVAKVNGDEYGVVVIT